MCLDLQVVYKSNYCQNQFYIVLRTLYDGHLSKQFEDPTVKK